MTLSEHEEREFARIAEGLRRDDPDLVHRVDDPLSPLGPLFEWLVMSGIVIGLGITTVGVHWHIVAFAAIGVSIAAVAPIALGVLLSPEHRRPRVSRRPLR